MSGSSSPGSHTHDLLLVNETDQSLLLTILCLKVPYVVGELSHTILKADQLLREALRFALEEEGLLPDGVVLAEHIAYLRCEDLLDLVALPGDILTGASERLGLDPA